MENSSNNRKNNFKKNVMSEVKFYPIEGDMRYPIGENIDQNQSTISEMADMLNEVYKDENFLLWCRGSSCAIIAGILSCKLNGCVKINHIKKEGEKAHCSSLINPELTFLKLPVNIIVDDFINTGRTVRIIIEKMKEKLVKPDALCVAGNVLFKFEEIDTYFCGEIGFK